MLVTMAVQLHSVWTILSPSHCDSVSLPSLAYRLTDCCCCKKVSFPSEVKIGNNTIKLSSYGHWLPNGQSHCHLIRLTYSHITHKYLTSAVISDIANYLGITLYFISTMITTFYELCPRYQRLY